jgi:ketosteroid isomerase-like protein
MPEESLALVRRLLEAWNRNDWDEMAAALDDEVIGIPPDGWPEGGSNVHGPAEVLRQFERLKDSWEEEHVDLVELREVEGDIVVHARWVTRGHNSGIELEVPISIQVTVQDGRITRAQFGVDAG